MAALIAAAGCTAPPAPKSDPARDVAAALEQSGVAWNRGDLAGFMSFYAPDTLTSWVSRGHVQRGWQKLYDQYEANYFAPGKSRDSLAFNEVAVRPFTSDVALCTARFALYRAGKVVASGPFTLIFVKHGERWQIIYDHTSADPK